jgi:Ca2+-transporting ATPase
LSEVVEDRDNEQLAIWEGIKGLAEKLDSSLERGLSKEDATSEMRHFKFVYNLIFTEFVRFGLNRVHKKAPKTFLSLFFSALQDKTLIILLISAIVSIILGVYVEEEG